jgi:hypothetical protein
MSLFCPKVQGILQHDPTIKVQMTKVRSKGHTVVTMTSKLHVDKAMEAAAAASSSN